MSAELQGEFEEGIAGWGVCFWGRNAGFGVWFVVGNVREKEWETQGKNWQKYEGKSGGKSKKEMEREGNGRKLER